MNIFWWQAIIIFLVNNIWFLYAYRKKRNDIADVAWGVNFIIVAFFSLILKPNLHSLIILGLVLLWGTRLATHIGKRFLKKDKEDARYLAWRENWGKNWVVFSWLKVFMLQGFFLYVISLPIITTSVAGARNFSLVQGLGILVWVFGFVFEVIGDRQLKYFLQDKDNQGKIMRYGLWKYTRHPNYFGESVMWWGICLFTWGSGFFWLNIISPITITYLLRFVSGVPLAEKSFADNKEFQKYKEKTPAMLPNFFIK
jgi:steroid 5-alpha reductase family enzyme